MKNFYPFLLLMLPTLSLSQTPSSRTLEVDLSDMCKSEMEREVHGLNCDELEPVEAVKTDESGKEWKVRFHFGFSRTQYHETDMRISSGHFDGEIRDVKMHERTSAHYYDPRTWEDAGEAFKWIDEPTNTFALSLEKGKNNFYFTVFHPKYLKTHFYKKENGGYEFREGTEDNRLNQPDRPEGFGLLYLQNTHKNMVWQIGYGRAIRIFDSENAGTLSYIPKADIGINTGEARTANIAKNDQGKSVFDDYTDDHKVQGVNASIGHRLEYQKGKVSVFVDHKTIYSKMKHGFHNGSASYNLRMSPVTFGVGISLFEGKKKKNKKK